ncbi:cytochrome P450 [Propylenella binzhouense]|uniref:Cytochrome P450 n=1 Tax=Propylenella binzhouense TaxID=2555902 RepID=A0A964WU44_9HYPH|nr:cytochrome P450 [Propylenella binzhouense]MYZ48470.1 cytochrome P450 [Propylenella binzhouense]
MTLDTLEPVRLNVPTDDVDLFCDDILRYPYEAYARLREKGPVVFLTRHNIFALPRYAPVRTVLEDHETYISGKGVGLSKFGNQSRRGTPIASDPPLHTKRRGLVAERLSLRSVREITPDLQRQADVLVGTVAEQGEFDGVADFSRRFPLMVMADLIGLPQDGREHLLEWADAGFNLFGPPNERVAKSEERFPEVRDYIRSLEQPGRLRPGSMGAAIYEAAARGEIEFDQCGPLIMAYLMAGLDTTINAISAALLLFGRHPDQWDLVRENPRLIAMALNEVIRLESPIQNLRRVVTREHELEGAILEEGVSVLVMFGSANRDESRWQDADRFDVKRNPVGHLAFGMGIHNCAGQTLARAEAASLLEALARRARRIEVGEPEWHLNNVIRGLERLPVRLVA